MFVNQISGLVDSTNPAVSLRLFLSCPRSPLPRARPHLAANHPLLLTPRLPCWPCLPSPRCPPSWLCSRPFLGLLLCSIIPTFWGWVPRWALQQKAGPRCHRAGMETMGGVLEDQLSPHPTIQPLLVLVLVSQGGFAALLEVMGIHARVPRGCLDRAEQESLRSHH